MDIFKPLVALLVIVNPIGIIPFYIHFTQGQTRAQRQRTIRVAAFTACVVIAVSAVAGLRVIEFFGISLASFQVGGGTLLLISALHMIDAKPAETRGEDAISDGEQRLDVGASVAVVPLAIPLLTGPATISTVVIYADRARHWWEHAVLASYGIVIGLAVWAAFSLSGTIARVLGKTGINVMTRLMGLILAALAVEVMADGLEKLFPILGSRLPR